MMSRAMEFNDNLDDNYRSTRAAVLGWFGGDCLSSRADTIARDAFELAKTYISSELPEKDRVKILSSRCVSMRGFAATLLEAQSKYEGRRSSKALTWLEKLSSRVVYYSAVLDVLVQHHPEFVSLVWGAFQFLFVAVVNQEELVKNLAKACSRIAETLPRADLSLILYPTSAMREAVARLYALIIKFIIRALRWYRQSKLMHALSSIAHPWGLDFEQELQEVERHARGVDELAQSASRAELREAHLQIHQTRSDLQLARGEILQLTKFVEDGFRQMTEFALANQTLQLRMSNDITSSKEMIGHVQLGQILSLSFMESLPTSGQCLAYCNSFWLRRQRSRQRHPVPDPGALQKWQNQQKLSFVVAEDSSPVRAKDFLVAMIGLLRRQGLPVLWALRPPDLQQSSLTTLDVIRMLLYQALEINASALHEAHPITIAHLREASSHDDWLLLFKRALRGASTVYIIFDSDLIDHVTERNKTTSTKFLMEFAMSLGPEKAKLIVSSHSFDAGDAQRDLGTEAVLSLQTGAGPSSLSALKRQRIRIAKRKHG